MKKITETEATQDRSVLSRLTIINRGEQSLILYDFSDDDTLTETEKKALNKSSGYTVLKPRIIVIGVGEYGNAIITRLYETGTRAVESIVTETNKIRLEFCNADKRVLIGSAITGGFDPGTDATIADLAAVQAKETFHKIISPADLIIIVAGMGDPVGFGAAPVIAGYAKQQGIPVLGMVLNPLSDEKLATYLPKKVTSFSDNFDTTIIVDSKTAVQCLSFSKEIIHLFIQQVIAEFIKSLSEGVLNINGYPTRNNIELLDLCSLLKPGGFGGLAFAEDIPQKVAGKCLRNWLSEVDNTKITGGIVNIVTGDLFRSEDAVKIVKSFSQIIGHELNILYSLRYEKGHGRNVRILAVFNGINRDFSGSKLKNDLLLKNFSCIYSTAGSEPVSEANGDAGGVP